MSYYPTLEELLSQDSEVLLEIKPSPRSLIGLLSRSIGAFLLASLIVWSLRSYTFRISPLWLYLV
ncbi:MAG: hypothetical protein KDD60_10615, partial [Bdellovibrionales bacterium]|nr:hypothetical protein [Bdellovibrionales bacterium]